MSERPTIVAVLRLLASIAARDLKNASSIGLNNLFFVAVFLMLGANGPRNALWSASPLLAVLGLPLLLTLSSGPLSRVPPSRLSLWPITGRGLFVLQIGSLLLNPILWVGLLLVLLKAGVALSVCFAGLMFGLRLAAPILIAAASKANLRLHNWQRLHRHPRHAASTKRSVVGGFPAIIKLSLRQLFRVLDLYAAAMIAIGGLLYRALTPQPQTAAYPMLAIGVAIALSTYAQQSFALDKRSGVERYRLLPLRGWQLLLAKDAGYLGVVAVLTAGLSLRAGLTFALVAIAAGRSTALQPQTGSGAHDAGAWRFTGGSPITGALQIFLGTGFAIVSLRVSILFSAVALALYALSVLIGGWLWECSLAKDDAVALDLRRFRTGIDPNGPESIL